MTTASPRPACRGFTLVELVVVLAVLAMVAAMSWPVLRRMLGKTELVAAAKQLRSVLVKTRLRAIENATSQEFRFFPGTGRFQTSSRSLSALDPPRPSTPRRSIDGRPVEDTLPHGVTFGKTPLSDRAFEERGPDGGEPEESSPPIVFQANGRAADLRVELRGPDGRRIAVALRGLTGSVRIGRIQQTGEVQP